jgi:hypothetical protein
VLSTPAVFLSERRYRDRADPEWPVDDTRVQKRLVKAVVGGLFEHIAEPLRDPTQGFGRAVSIEPPSHGV